jgi:hypothetical protein
MFVVGELMLEIGRDWGLIVDNFIKDDILIITGNISNVLIGRLRDPIMKHFLLECKKKYKHVMFIAGNREYYGCVGNMRCVLNNLLTICAECGVHFLNRKTVKIDNITFGGITMWDVNYEDEGHMHSKDILNGRMLDLKFLEDNIDNIDIYVSHYPIENKVIGKYYISACDNGNVFTLTFPEP